MKRKKPRRRPRAKRPVAGGVRVPGVGVVMIPDGRGGYYRIFKRGHRPAVPRGFVRLPDRDLHNPPPFVRDKAKWEEAKAHVAPHARRYRNPYAVVTDVYRKMGGRFRGRQ